MFHERLAYVYLKRQGWGEALQESREALRLDPLPRFAWMILIQCLLRNKDLEHAQEESSPKTSVIRGLT
jgi:Tfp pilus assembly protein PilF